MAKLRYAHKSDYEIDAMADGLLAFKTRQEAVERLARLRDRYIISKQNEEMDDDQLLLWISGYKVTKAEKEEGYTGNFALVSIENEENLYNLRMEKVEQELRAHPQRKRKKRSMPDFTHPFLRKVRKGKVSFYSKYEAQEELKGLYLDYTDVAVPASNFSRLYIMIYSREHGDDPVRKYILDVRRDGNRYTVTIEENRSYDPNHRRKIDAFHDVPTIWQSIPLEFPDIRERSEEDS